MDKHFQTRFKYTTDLRDIPLADVRALTPLGRFLLGSKTGHCEFFATAAVLMLRQCHVPARYARGFLVAAAEQHGDLVTVREREAHAWVRVWIDGRWRDFDPTPSADLDAVIRPEDWLGRLGRAWNDFRFAATRWWWLGEKKLLRQAYWLAIPVLAILVWRFRKIREASSPLPIAAPPAPTPAWPGLDSEWFQVEPLLIEAGGSRVAGEPLPLWHRRLDREGWPTPVLDGIRSAAELHLRLRFDPKGLPASEREELRRCAGRLLVEVPALPPRTPHEEAFFASGPARQNPPHA